MPFYSASPVRFGVGVSGTTTTLGANDPQVGTRINEAGNEYLFIYNATGSAVTQNHIMVVQSSSSGYSLTRSSVIGLDFAMGVAANVDIPAAAYAWVMTKGFCDLEPVSNLTEGLAITPGTDGQVADPAVGASTGTTGFVFARCQEVTAACGAAKCYVTCF